MEVWVQQWAGLPNSSSLTNYVYALATQGRPNTLGHEMGALVGL
ncbi:hypothetical protein HaLaN_08761 [Haematococcus lacustris]|uniref:Uncharacterized protein n=1 Tax=Haematococcus lacustris TaxID=44745 RepID=A0A699YTN3_HAELA|nr:hypothetical protein HaLaN_08761 [Haematococcus lacustris]